MRLTHDAERTTGQRRRWCFKVKVDRVMAAFLKQEVKGAVQRKDVIAMQSCGAPASSRQGSALHFRPFLNYVSARLQGYVRKPGLMFLPEMCLACVQSQQLF